jgi:hypothetical protein
LTFTGGRVQGLRHHWQIPCHQPTDHDQQPGGELLTVATAAKELGLATSTLHRWLTAGFIAGEQVTPGASWQIRLTEEVRNLFVDMAPVGWRADRGGSGCPRRCGARRHRQVYPHGRGSTAIPNASSGNSVCMLVRHHNGVTCRS